MGLFSARAVGLPLYPYQIQWANYCLASMAAGRIETITIEMPRQSGKNETSAQLEVAALARFGKRGGSIVKCAPTFKPQIVNSRARFGQRADMVTERIKWLKFKPSMGYIYSYKRASIHFLSAEPSASVVGATASLAMEVDEAQDVNQAKFDKDFSPMRASRGAPIIAYGTTWTDDTLLERFKADVLEGRSRGKVIRVLPDVVARDNPAYGLFVDSEVGRLGREHPFVKTQYFLEPLKSAGRMLNRQQMELMIGNHPRQDRRKEESLIVAGVDFAGADEELSDIVSLATASARDSVGLTVGAVVWVKVADGLMLPRIRTLARYEWVNVNPVTLHNALYELLWSRWRVNLCYCDATGIGATGTAMLAKAINKMGQAERVQGITFDSAWNTQTQLAFNYLAAINNGHLQDYQPVGDDSQPFDPIAIAGQPAPPTDRHQQIWWQRGHARLEAKAGQRVRMYVPSSEGHDDMLLSDALMVHAAYNAGQPQTMTGASVDFYRREVGAVALPEPARSDEEIERMLG